MQEKANAAADSPFEQYIFFMGEMGECTIPHSGKEPV